MDAIRKSSKVLHTHIFEEEHYENPTKEEKYGLGLRHAIGLLGFFLCGISYCHRFSLSLIITEMASSKHLTKIDPDRCPLPPGHNDTPVHKTSGEFDWDEHTQGLVLSSFFYGYVVTPIVGGWVAEHYGAKHVIGAGVLASTLGALLSPVVSRELGWKAFMALRIIMGFGQGPIYPSLSVVLSQWCPAVERGTLSAMMFAGAQLGNMAAMAITGVVMSKFGWDAGFYLWGALGGVWLIAWYIVFTNSPVEHPWISNKEQFYIMKFRGRTASKKIGKTPWLKMAKNLPLWALVIAQIGHDWGLFTIVADLPKYMKSVLNFSLKTNGLLSGLPYLVMWVFAIISGLISDWMVGPKQMNVTIVRKIFISIASVGPGFGLMAASYSGCSKELSVFFFIFGMGTMGAFIPSLKVNPVDLSPNFSGSTMAVVNGLGSVSGIITPYIVGVLTPNAFMQEWRLVFWICTAVLVGTNIIYLIWGTAKVQDFNEIKKEEEKPTQ